MQRKFAAISPLALLTLAACGGGGSGISSNSFSAVSPKIVKGPLQNAFVFLDYDGDGVHDADEPSGSTNASGELASALTPTQDYRIVATTNATTTDAYSGKVISGVTLSAPDGAEVVTPLTTLLGEDVSDADLATATAKIATALGLTIPNGQTLLDYDPFDVSSPANAATQLAYEKATTQVLNVIEKMVELAPTEDGVLDKAAKAVYDYLSVQTVAVDLTSAANGGALDTIGTSFNTLTDADVSATLAAKVAELAAANTTVAAATSASDLKSAGNILELKAGSVTVSEMLENLSAGAEVGTLTPLSTYTVDASTYEILSGDHSDKFEIDGSTLKVKAGATFEAVAGSTSEITLDVKVTDSSGKVHVSSIALDVLDVSTHIELTADRAAETNFLENVAAGSEIGVLTPAGTNTVDASTYEILPGTGSDKFDITVTDDVAKLVVATGATFEAQDLGEITLNIKVDDTSGEAHVTQITLNVLDVAEFDGNVVKGPLENALVFIDLNDNGVWDEGVDSEQVRTDATGGFSVDVYIPDGVTPEIVAVSDGTARDASSGEYLSDGAMLSAPEGASVVTPMTTLVAEADLSAADVAAALGLPDGVDPLTYNPYASDVDAASALQVEKAAHQVMNTISALKVAGEEAGLTADAALTKSLTAFKTVIVAAKEADSEVNLNDSTDSSGFGLGALTDSFVTELASSSADDFEAPPEGADEAALAAALQDKVDAAKNKVNFVKESVIQGVATVNDLVASVPEGTSLSDDTSAFFSVGTKLAQEVASAVADGNANAITVKNPTIAKAVGSNKAATKIELKSQGEAVTSIDENPNAGDVVGLLSADDTGNLTYSIVGGGAGNNFEILVDGDGAKVVVSEGANIDFEAGGELSFKVKVSDSLGKSHVETITLAVGDVDEVPTIPVTELSINEGASIAQDLGVVDPEGKDVTLALSTQSDLFEIQDGKLVSKQIIDQDDVNAGAQTIKIMMTDTGSGQTTAHDIIVNFKNVNDDPVFVTQSLVDATEGASYSQNLKATDLDSDTPEFVIISGPDWLSISGNTLSGTVPNTDADIASDAIIKIAARDANGGESVQDFSLKYVNVNDAPQFTLETISASITEKDDDIGAVEETITGVLQVVDPDNDPSDLTVTLSGGVLNAQNTYTKVGDYGQLTFDPADNSYVYTPNDQKIEPLHNEAVKDTFSFKVTDGDLSDTVRLDVDVVGANDNPRVAPADDQNLAELSAGLSGTIVGPIEVLDGSANAGFVLADYVEGQNNNNLFARDEASGLLKLADGVTIAADTPNELWVEVYAQDYAYNSENTLVAVEGTKSTEPVSVKVTKLEGDPAPKIMDISTDYDGDILKIGDQLNFTITLSEKVAANGTGTVTLSNGGSVSIEVGTEASQTLTGTYVVDASHDDALANSPLQITNLSSGSIKDMPETGTGQEIDISNLANIEFPEVFVDASAPNAKITAGDGGAQHQYASSTGRMVLQGENLRSLVNDESGDVTDIVDWTKLTWNVDALTATTHTFSQSDILSARVNEGGTELIVDLSSAGMTTLHALSGFGGAAATGGTVDGISIASGFLKDLAGNLSTGISVSSAAIHMEDVSSPVLAEIDISGAFTSPQGAGRVRGDAFIVGDTLTFSATLSDTNDLQDLSEMKVSFTLTNGKVLTLTRPENATGASKTFSADYIIADGDTDSADLGIDSYSVQNIVDISGNTASNTLSLDQVSTKTFSGMATDEGIAVDANAPTAKILGTVDNAHTYDIANGIITLKGESLGTVTFDDARDISSTIDWSKLIWNVDGNGAVTHEFTAADVTSAVVNAAGDELAINLTDTGKSNLSNLDGFGGTTASGGTEDSIDVSAGMLRDVAGNLSSANSTPTSIVSLTDATAPVIQNIEIFGEFTSTQVSGRTQGDPFIAGDSLTFKVTIFDDTALQNKENMSVNLTLTNNKVLSLVRPQGADGADKTFAATYVIASGDTDATDLQIRSYTIDNVLDLAGNKATNAEAIGEITPTFTGMATSTIVVDANAPTAKLLGTETVPHTYDATTGVLTLSGEGLATLSSDLNVKEVVDWSELVWNVNGTGSTTLAFAKSDVETAVSNSDGTTLTVTLSNAGKTKLHGLDGYGGSEATGGVADVINVGGGFLRDAAGNVSSEPSTSASNVVLTDTSAPVLETVGFVSSEPSPVGPGDNIRFTAEFTDDSSTVIADDAEMVLTLNNGASVTLTKSQETGEEDFFLAGTLNIASGQDLDTLVGDQGYVPLAVTNIDVSGVRDDAGNQADEDALLSKVTIDDVIIDTKAPTLQQALLNTTDGTMTFLFDEVLASSSIDTLKTAIDAVTELSDATASGTANTKITATFSGTPPPAGEAIDFAVSFDDLAGNTTTITEFEIGIIG